MSDGAALRVGYGQRNYGAARNCYAPVPGVRHMRVGRVPIERLARGRTSVSLKRGVYIPLGRPAVDIVHLWNQISLGRAPWGVSFEGGLPRVPDGRSFKLLQDRLKSPACRFIAGISSFAVDGFLKTLPLDLRREVQSKTTTIYPYQSVNAPEAIDPPRPNEPLRVIFVGSVFFGKGGEALLRFVKKYGSEYNVNALIISRLSSRDRCSPSSYDEAYVASIRRMLEQEERISWVPQLPNDRVLDAMKRSHLLLFPTLADTFGYVSLEAMSCGVPVVATTVQALPEVVDESVGWTIQLPLEEDRYWSGLMDNAWASGQDAYEEALDRIVRGFLQAVEDVRRDPETLRKRSSRCLAKVNEQFGSERTARMRAVYSAGTS